MKKICTVNPDHELQDIDGSFQFCPFCGGNLEISSEPIITTIYLHSCKDTLYEVGEEIGLSPTALTEFGYTATEVDLSVRVDPRTGTVMCFALNGVNLNKEVNL